MADFVLTGAADNFTGTDQDDYFWGTGGGVDTLNGGGGNDFFDILSNAQFGTINGGDGIDTVRGSQLSRVTFSNVEILQGSNVEIRLAQLLQFQTLQVSGIRLVGDGGTLDLSVRQPGQSVTFYADQNYAVNVTGSTGDDQFFGSNLNDTLSGGAGNDNLEGWTGDNLLIGGAGDDTIGTRGNDTIDAGDGNDMVHTPGFELEADRIVQIDLGAGDDWMDVRRAGGAVNGGAGDDTIYAANGDITTLALSSVEYLQGQSVTATIAQLDAFVDLAVNQVVIGGAGGAFDASRYSGFANGAQVFGAFAASGVQLTGTVFRDEFTGSRYDDVLDGGAGNDILNPNGGHDTLIGGDGDDFIYLHIEPGTVSGPGALLAQGGAGFDQFFASVYDNPLSVGVVDGGDGIDRLFAQNAYLNGLTFSNVEIIEIEGVTGTIAQLQSFDTVKRTTNDGAIEIDLRGDGGVMDLAPRIGSSYSLVVDGAALTSAITLSGTGQADELYGTAFNDALTGRAGNDTLDGGAGTDTLVGGVGNDVYRVTGMGDTIVELAAQGFDSIVSEGSFSLWTLNNVERLELTGAIPGFLRGNNGVNTLIGNAGSNIIEGFAGGDTIMGLGGRDTITGGLGRDIIAPGLERDTVRWTAVAESTGVDRDTVSEFVFTHGNMPYEMLDFHIVPTAIRNTITTGALTTANFDGDLQAAVHGGVLGAGEAVMFDPNGGDLDLTGYVYLIVDANGVAGYQAGQDYVVQFTSTYGAISLGNFI